MSDNKVLARVEGREITESDVERLLRNLGPQRAAQFNSPGGKSKLLEELINQELFYVDALEKGLDKEEDFLEEVENMKSELLKQYGIRKILEQVEVSDEEAFNYYKENRNQFRTNEKIHAKHILVEDREEADRIYWDLKKGLFFEEAAKKYSRCPSAAQGGSLDYFERGQMVPDFEEVAFKLDINEISRPVKTQYGYHIIKVVDKKRPGISDFDDVKPQIAHHLIGMKQQQAYAQEVNRLRGQFKVTK